MKPFFALLPLATSLAAHDLATSDREAMRLHILQEWRLKESSRHLPASDPAGGTSKGLGKTLTASGASALPAAAAAVAAAAGAPRAAQAFLPFKRLDIRADGDFLYIGSNGLPDHNMMVGITAWQQQVPLPQTYFDDNAWRIPLKPVPAKEPALIQGRFLRGAIALAVNGIPIFNPQNNRGEISQEIGELDQWGGHCGRADDYHYHITPLHLQAQAGGGMPVAYALDGYPIYGLAEPDGSPVGRLDVCHGHESPGIGYHYHASEKYPYVIGGFHGEVVEYEGQVDPQPRAQPVRPSLPALRGARITGFESTGKNSYRLSYEVEGDKRSVSYSIGTDGTCPFQFDNGREGRVEETYRAGGGGGGGRGGPGGPTEARGRGKGKGKGGPGGPMRRDDAPPTPEEERGRPQPSQASSEGILDLNGDGIVSAQEFADNARTTAAKKGLSQTEAMAKARSAFTDMDKDHSGRLEAGEWQAAAPASQPMPAGEQPRKPQAQDRPMKGQGGGGKGGQQAFVERADQPRSSDGRFLLTSPAVEDLGDLPAEFTGDGEAATPPLEWKQAPAETQSFALIMDHADRDGNMKWYWTLYDIPADTVGLPKNASGIGRMGTGFKGEVGYEPPMSRGPGAKTYVITVYALASPLKISGTPGREELLAAMKDKVLASSSLRVIHVSKGQPGDEPPGGGARRPAVMNERERPAGEPAARPGSSMPPAGPESQAEERPKGAGGAKGKGRPKGGPPGLIKPGIADTMKLNVYADNWFVLYVNGRLVAVDSIQFTPHNVVSVDFLPEYPMTIAVLAKDNADPKTGLEYGSSIGDGGFCLKFADGTVTNASWKARNFFHGPVNGDTANPKVTQEPLPENWWAVNFDDSAWKNAKEYSVEQVDPKQPYFDNDFEGARFIWSDDIALDNTVIFRTRVEKPGWTPRWNTRPDLDVSGAPAR